VFAEEAQLIQHQREVAVKVKLTTVEKDNVELGNTDVTRSDDAAAPLWQRKDPPPAA